MQDCYAGDIGDYGKFALLRELHRQGLSIGVNWYKTDVQAKGNDGKYCIPDRFAGYDTDLSSHLKQIFHSNRSIKALEDAQLIDGAVYFSKCVPDGDRGAWHEQALRELAGADLVFLDPDNGMIVPSAGKESKYVLDAEVKDYLCQGQSVLVYQHRPRIKEAVFMDRMVKRFAGLGVDIQVITFPRYTVRDYFAISICEEHRLKIHRAISAMVNGGWGSGNKPMCRMTRLDKGM